MEKYKRILVTSALPYANGPIHLGHLAGAYLNADLYVRYQKLKGRQIIYICGSDEHGVPITIAAEKKGISPQKIVDEFHSRNLKAFKQFGISFDYYGRTSSPVHHKTSQEFFLNLYKKNIFKKITDKQLYDEESKMFLPDRYVKGTCPNCSYNEAYGDQCEKCGSSLSPLELIEPKSALTGKTPVLRETTHWYLPLGEFQEKLSTWLDTKKDWKINVLGQVKSWLNEGLKDRAVTRDLTWGVPVPLEDSKNKVLYVWFDAPIGYISATREWADLKGDPEQWKQYWQKPDTKLVHFIGKDNIVFHCIMFPAMLMAHGDYILPDNVPANEFLNLQGRKLSTSKNYAVWLEDYLLKFPVDPLRYYLSINAPETKDADFTWQEYMARNNGELADILGNFVNRTLAFAKKHFNHKVPSRGPLNKMDKEIIKILSDAPATVGTFFEHFTFRKTATGFMDVARACNKYFNDTEPWKTAKTDRQRCATALNICIQACRTLAIISAPVIPFSAEKIWNMLNLEGSVLGQCWDTAADFVIENEHELGDLSILFAKFEQKQIQGEIDRLEKNQESEPDKTETAAGEKTKIKYEDFSKIQLKVAQVVQAEKIKKTDKLLKLTLEIEGRQRQIVAGIAQHYTPDEIKGKKIVIVANLEAVTIRGIESNGMLLAAEDDDGIMSVLSLDRDVKTGANVK
ncbi:methionine--tRNA ligase [candidate division KSB1 bacterium]|nr:methionine--tRNA ligase [candidate division KSB1 bacterium]